jgi:hypothetical protein
MFIFLALYFKGSRDAYSSFTEAVSIYGRINHLTGSTNKLRRGYNSSRS